jgi:hypothetical protein
VRLDGGAVLPGVFLDVNGSPLREAVGGRSNDGEREKDGEHSQQACRDVQGFLPFECGLESNPFKGLSRAAGIVP